MKDSNNLTMANLPETYFSRKHLYKSSLDHIYYSNSLEEEVSYKATDHAATDHRPIILELKKRTSKRARPEVKLVEKRCFKEFSQKAFNKNPHRFSKRLFSSQNKGEPDFDAKVCEDYFKKTYSYHTFTCV